MKIFAADLERNQSCEMENGNPRSRVVLASDAFGALLLCCTLKY